MTSRALLSGITVTTAAGPSTRARPLWQGAGGGRPPAQTRPTTTGAAEMDGDDPARETAHGARVARLRDDAPPQSRGGHLLGGDGRGPAAVVRGLLAPPAADPGAVR